MTIETVFNITVVIFTVANLASMGLDLNVRDAVKALRNPRFVALLVAWSWVIGPAFAYLIAKSFPIAEPYAMGLILASPAPCAPFYPMVVRLGRADVAYAAALLLLTAIGTVALMPLLLPLMIPGLSVSAVAIAKPLITLVLIPLLVAMAVRHFAPLAAARLYPVVKAVAGLFTLIILIFVLALYGKDMLSSVGSFAIGTQLIFLGGMALLSYGLAFGLRSEQRASLALGMGTRNIAAVFAVLTAIPNPESRLVVMVVMVVPLSVLVAFAAATLFAARADRRQAETSAPPANPQIQNL